MPKATPLKVAKPRATTGTRIRSGIRKRPLKGMTGRGKGMSHKKLHVTAPGTPAPKVAKTGPPKARPARTQKASVKPPTGPVGAPSAKVGPPTAAPKVAPRQPRWPRSSDKAIRIRSAHNLSTSMTYGRSGGQAVQFKTGKEPMAGLARRSTMTYRGKGGGQVNIRSYSDHAPSGRLARTSNTQLHVRSGGNLIPTSAVKANASFKAGIMANRAKVTGRK